MGTDRSDDAYDMWRQATDKFDYFQVGLAGALAGYVGQSLSITVLGLNGPTIELGAFGAFATSMAAGLIRIERGATILRLSATRLYALDMAATAESGPKNAVSHDVVSGEIYTPDDLREAAKEYRAKAATAGVVEAGVARQAKRWFALRDWLLVAGFVLLGLARVLPAIQAR